jgi:hypothetical protein
MELYMIALEMHTEALFLCYILLSVLSMGAGGGGDQTNICTPQIYGQI